MDLLPPLTALLTRLGDPGALGWLLLVIGWLWLNTRAGMPRAPRDLKWRGAGFVLLFLAAVLGMGRGLVEAWPWSAQAALAAAVLVPLAAAALARRGHVGLAVLAGLSVPFFILMVVTSFFGLWLNLALTSGVLLTLAVLTTVVGALLTWRTPRPAQPMFSRQAGGRAGGFSAHFSFGATVGRAGRGDRTPPPDVVDVEARAVDETPPPALPRRED